MNRRDAKRKACHQAALVLRSALDAGWEYANNMEDEGFTEDDIYRWEVGMVEVIEELFRRGHE